MKHWYSAAELAGLPGMPDTKRGVNIRGQSCGWRTRPRAAQGGGQEIALASLPAETRQHLVAQAEGKQSPAEEAQARQVVKERGLLRFAAIPEKDPRKLRARAREWVLGRWTAFAQQRGVSPTACIDEFLTAYCLGDIVVPPEHMPWLPMRKGARSLGASALKQWRAALRETGIAGLMPDYGNRKGQFKVAVNGDLERVILGCIHSAPHITPGKIHQFLQAEYPQHAVLITPKSIGRFIDSWKATHAQAWTAFNNPDKWKNNFQVSFGSQHENITEPNQLWEMDSTPGDWHLIGGRHCVITVLDLYTRRTMQYVSKTSKAEAVCLAFRKAVLAWGVPKGVRTDNGADYKSRQFVTVLNDLEIEHILCEPFASEQKGSVERAQKTMSHGILDLLPGYSGHNVADAQVIRARKSFEERLMTVGATVDVKLTAQDLQLTLDQWAEYVYGRDEHAGLGGRSPWEVATAWALPIRKISDERALDALLSEIAGNRTVTKKGLRLDNYLYIASALVAYIGEAVQVRRDVADIGRVYVYNLAGAFVCMAEAPEVLGISRAEVAAVATAEQKKRKAADRVATKEFTRGFNKDIARAVLDHRIREAANVIALPARAVEYSTAALREHGIAARSTDVLQATPTDERTQQAIAALEARMAAPTAAVLSADDPQRRYRHWLRLDQRVADGGWLNKEERTLWESYPNGSEYRSMKSFFDNFGLGLHEAEA